MREKFNKVKRASNEISDEYIRDDVIGKRQGKHNFYKVRL